MRRRDSRRKANCALLPACMLAASIRQAAAARAQILKAGKTTVRGSKTTSATNDPITLATKPRMAKRELSRFGDLTRGSVREVGSAHRALLRIPSVRHRSHLAARGARPDKHVNGPSPGTRQARGLRPSGSTVQRYHPLQGLTAATITPKTRAPGGFQVRRAFRDPRQDLALYEVLPVGSGPAGTEEGAILRNSNDNRGRE